MYLSFYCKFYVFNLLVKYNKYYNFDQGIKDVMLITT